MAAWRSCRDTHALDSHELQRAGLLGLNLKAQSDCLKHSVHKLVQRTGLGMTTRERGHRRHVVPLFVALDNDTELAAHGASFIGKRPASFFRDTACIVSSAVAS